MRTKAVMKFGKYSIFLVVTAVLGGWLLTRQAYAAGTTVTVNGNGDLNDFNPGDGVCDVIPTVPGDQCGLRAAIEELNALGPDTTPHRIEFDISGTGPFTITPASELPAITVPVVIDGETQPGASCPTSNDPANLMIVLDGSNAGTTGTIDGLTFNAGSEGSTIRGLVIGNFDIAGIRLLSDGNIVRCNHLGVGVDGLSSMGNDYGVYISSIADSNIIGGDTDLDQRNVLSANTFDGIRILGEDNRIRGNFIGTTADGLGDLGNNGGIYVGGDFNSIGDGGANSLAGNVISGNNDYGIRVNGGQGNILRSNFLGVAKDGVTPLPNADGIELVGEALANWVGGVSVGQGNLIAHNSRHGVTVYANIVGVPAQNEIRGNAIYANDILGIDLGEDGVDTNDPDDSDSGENERQNYPVITGASTLIELTLESQPNILYTVDVYRNDDCHSSGFGEGQEHLSWLGISTNADGQISFTFSAAFLGVTTGDGITATATDPDGNTSEFSACVLVDLEPTPTPTVTATSTSTATPSPTPTVTQSPTPTATSTATSSPTVGPSPTPTATASASPTATVPPEVTPTETPDPTQNNDFFTYLPFVMK